VRRLVLALALLAPIARLDAQVRDAVQAARRPALERPMRLASDVGRPAIVLGGLLAVALLDGASGRATAGAALLALAPANLAVEGLKWTVNRPRPDGERKRSNSSFPSSHAANAAALAYVLGRRWRRLAPAWCIAAGIVSFSRIYLDRHFLSDVLVGLAIGGAGAWLMARLAAARSARSGALPAS
jgi:undecaprenyl-diphosphatase